MIDAQVYKFLMDGPADTSGLVDLINKGEIDPADIVAIIAKTEGNGRVNDFTRAYATHVFTDLLSKRCGITREEVAQRCAMIMSGGCEGVMSPHATVFVRRTVEDRPCSGKALSVGVAFTPDLMPEEVGTTTQVFYVADAVQRAMKDALIDSIEDVHYVQVKCPLLTSQRINEAAARGKTVVVTDTVKSMGYSNGSSGLGIAVALGDVAKEDITQEVICTRLDMFPTRGASSAGVELNNCEIVVMGNSSRSCSNLTIGHSVLHDFIDGRAAYRAMQDAGVEFSCCPSDADLKRVVQVFAKGLVDIRGEVRGKRTTLLTDSDLGTRPARAVVNAILATMVGDTAIYVSAGWGYHQGPVGGGVVAAIVRNS